jgi:hypothetical protein
MERDTYPRAWGLGPKVSDRNCTRVGCRNFSAIAGISAIVIFQRTEIPLLNG